MIFCLFTLSVVIQSVETFVQVKYLNAYLQIIRACLESSVYNAVYGGDRWPQWPVQTYWEHVINAYYGFSIFVSLIIHNNSMM